MVTLRLEGFGEVTVPTGTSILDAATKGHLPIGSACGGVCACSTCHVYVKQGAHLLSAPEDEEADVLDKAFDVRSTSRLGCQAKIVAEGTIAVEISRESLEAYENEHPSERGRHTSASAVPSPWHEHVDASDRGPAGSGARAAQRPTSAT